MQLIQELNERGITIHLVDADHVALIPKDKVSPELIEKVKASKQELLRTLRAAQDKSRRKNVVPGPELRTITVFSKVLKREVFISWQGDNPGTVFFDGVPYTFDEIAKLKEMPLTPEDLRAIHDAKCVFEGKLNLPCVERGL